ncbi:MAG: Na/Pi cotransporter family protein [Bacteroidota bacterium]
MQISLLNILNILGSLALFIFGMKLMSEGIQRAAGSQIRNILRRMTRNRYLGLLTGFLITALVQSSSATTVMTVSFVNAGLLSLVESAGIMMGANIGTTVTGWLISILGFNIKLHQLSLPILVVAVPLLFIRRSRSRSRYWGEFLTGFALLFMGLDLLQNYVPDLGQNPEVLSFLKDYANSGFLSNLLFVMVGAFLTIIVQSSSAAMALTLVMCNKGWIPFDVAAAMILGENIGTTITAEVASLVGNTQAKRSARIHSMFNIIGTTWMLFLLPFFLRAIDWALQKSFVYTSSAFDDPVSIPIALSAFHTVFNITNALLLIWLVTWLVKLAIRMVPSRGDAEQSHYLHYISAPGKTPELSILEVQKEVARFGEITSRMSSFANQMLLSTDQKEQRFLSKKLKKYEEITDRIEIELTEYLTKLSREEMADRTSVRIRSIMNICNDLERIGDLFFQFSKSVEYKASENIWFNEYQRQRMKEMFTLINQAFQIMQDNLSAAHYDAVDISFAREIEKKINEKRDLLRKENLVNIESKKRDYNLQSAMIYNTLFSSLEKIGDHIMNISRAIIGEI